MYVQHVHVYLYTYVIHCWNGCTDMFYNCVIFVLLNLKKKKKERRKKQQKQLNKTTQRYLVTLYKAIPRLTITSFSVVDIFIVVVVIGIMVFSFSSHSFVRVVF